MLIAYASAPGTVAPDRPGDYGAYATAIAEMLRAPGTDLDTAFTHIRSRTHLTTEGQQTPWHVSALGESIELVPPEAATASVPPPPPIRQARPMRDIGPDEAYALAIEMDTLEGYTGFVQAYPGHPYTQRVWPMIRARREALAWMRALEINTPQSYWTYLRRYPNGMYAFDAERRLRRLGSPFAPPPDFAMMEFDDVPMALVDEPREYVDVYRVGPPPPLGLYGAPRPAYLANLPPPQRRGGGPGSRILPALAVGIPLMAALAPAPRRALPPDAPGRPGRPRIARGESEPRLRLLLPALPRTRSLRPQALCRLPATTVRRAGAQRRAANGPRAPRAEHRAALRPTTLSLRRVRSRQILLLHLLRAARRHRRAVRRLRQVVRPTGCGVSGRLRGLPTGRHPEGLQRQELLLPMQQRRTRSALHHANSPRSAPGVRPVVARLPASPTARRRPARRRNPPRRQRGLKGHRRRRTGHRRRRARRLGRRDRRRR